MFNLIINIYKYLNIKKIFYILKIIKFIQVKNIKNTLYNYTFRTFFVL